MMLQMMSKCADGLIGSLTDRAVKSLRRFRRMDLRDVQLETMLTIEFSVTFVAFEISVFHFLRQSLDLAFDLDASFFVRIDFVAYRKDFYVVNNDGNALIVGMIFLEYHFLSDVDIITVSALKIDL
jgi:hypothetical protein